MPISDLYSLRLGTPHAISAVSGVGVAELLEIIDDMLPREPEASPEDESIKLALVGRPNVGKSAITNRLLGYERSIVSDMPGTTRDAVDTRIEWKGQELTLIDTAGMRRKARVRAEETSLEYHMVLRSLRAIDRCDVVIVVCESGGVAEQDTKIAGYAHEAGKGVLVAINKWDLIEEPGSGRKTAAQKDYDAFIQRYLPFVSYAPIHYISALNQEGLEPLVDDAIGVYGTMEERIPTAALNDLVRRAVADHPPPSVKGRQMKIRYATQVSVKPPTVVIFCNQPDLLHFSYLRYLDNTIRGKYPFRGVPLKIELRKSGDDEKNGELRISKKRAAERAAAEALAEAD